MISDSCVAFHRHSKQQELVRSHAERIPSDHILYSGRRFTVWRTGGSHPSASSALMCYQTLVLVGRSRFGSSELVNRRWILLIRNCS